MTNINVGDKVVVVNAEDSQYPKGTVLTVTENDYTSLPYLCLHESGTREWMAASEVELYSTSTNQLEDRVTALESELAELKASLAPKVHVRGVGLATPVRGFEFTVPGHLEWKAQPGKRAPQTANELRKAAIKLAQESVAESFYTNIEGNDVIKTSRHGDLRAFFTKNKESRTVSVVLKYAYTGTDRIVLKGQATCDPSDVFNVDIGEAIALDRALSRVTAVEILRAPNPTDIVVGMLVEPKPSSPYGGGAYIAMEVDSDGDVYDKPGYGWANEDGLDIIEDTGAQY